MVLTLFFCEWMEKYYCLIQIVDMRRVLLQQPFDFIAALQQKRGYAYAVLWIIEYMYCTDL